MLAKACGELPLRSLQEDAGRLCALAGEKLCDPEMD